MFLYICNKMEEIIICVECNIEENKLIKNKVSKC